MSQLTSAYASLGVITPKATINTAPSKVQVGRPIGNIFSFLNEMRIKVIAKIADAAIGCLKDVNVSSSKIFLPLFSLRLNTVEYRKTNNYSTEDFQPKHLKPSTLLSDNRESLYNSESVKKIYPPVFTELLSCFAFLAVA